MENNLFLTGVALLTAILTIVVYFFDIQRKTKYPLLIFSGAVFVTCLVILVISTLDSRKKEPDERGETSLEKPASDTAEGRTSQTDTSVRSQAAADTAKSYVVYMDTITDMTTLSRKDVYVTRFYDSEMMFLRNRALTSDEISISNKCTVYVSLRPSDLKDGTKGAAVGLHIYEDLAKDECQRKKLIDDETGRGYVVTGVPVELLESQGSFYHIRIISNGVDGWVAARLAGKPTLVKITDSM